MKTGELTERISTITTIVIQNSDDRYPEDTKITIELTMTSCCAYALLRMCAEMSIVTSKISTIRWVRNEYGLGLKESKNLVEYSIDYDNRSIF